MHEAEADFEHLLKAEKIKQDTGRLRRVRIVARQQMNLLKLIIDQPDQPDQPSESCQETRPGRGQVLAGEQGP